VQCRRCLLIYANPFPVPDDLDALYSEEQDYFHSHLGPEAKAVQRERIVALLEPYTGGPGRLLDVGAGLGETVAAALFRGWDAYGIESSATFAARASWLCGDRVHHGDIDSLPARLSERPFDAVTLSAVLEHLHQPDRAIATIAAALRPGGALLLDVPNELGAYFRAGNLFYRLHRKDWVVNLAPTFSPYHVFGFSRRSLTALLRKHGLSPVWWYFYPTVPLPASFPWAKRILRRVNRVIERLPGVLAEPLCTYVRCIAMRTGARSVATP
jgi:SAM-dependent methyltransferase